MTGINKGWAAGFIAERRSEKTVQEPVPVTGAGIAAIAAAEQPEAASFLVLNLIVIAYCVHLTVALPPLAGDPLRPAGAVDTMLDVAPGEGAGGIIRQQRNGVDRLRRSEQAHGPWQVLWPIQFDPGGARALGREWRCLPHATLRHIALDQLYAIEPRGAEPVRQAVHQLRDTGGGGGMRQR